MTISKRITVFVLGRIACIAFTAGLLLAAIVSPDWWWRLVEGAQEDQE